MALECNLAYIDLDIGIALALHHPPHQVILCNQILGLQQVNPQEPLQHEDCKCYTESTTEQSIRSLDLLSQCIHFSVIQIISVLPTEDWKTGISCLLAVNLTFFCHFHR